MASNRSIIRGGNKHHILLADTASVMTIAASLLLMKRLKWTSKDAKKKRRYFQYKVIQTLVGPTLQMEPVDSQASALFQADSKESSALLMLTTYSLSPASSASNN
ncbi:unknown protein [Seminavis robusta]|uniref:Uncharacterized protein n=1 Tax=Seminavis robusta TaxID=568900 RepID=A0A9N8HMH0_9STRA|nr:unknown protein [Seminavis robusta]|eukprot:Sro999_g229590.1 n/a (105) ;mRNA; f:3488-3802